MMVVDENKNALTPYNSWPQGLGKPTNLNFATCVSGVLFPVNFLIIMKNSGDEYRSKCPRNDDLWLTFLAIENDIPITQINSQSLHFSVIPGSQKISLKSTNVFENENDVQIQATFTKNTISKLIDLQNIERSQD